MPTIKNQSNAAALRHSNGITEYKLGRKLLWDNNYMYSIYKFFRFYLKYDWQKDISDLSHSDIVSRLEIKYHYRKIRDIPKVLYSDWKIDNQTEKIETEGKSEKNYTSGMW